MAGLTGSYSVWADQPVYVLLEACMTYTIGVATPCACACACACASYSNARLPWQV